MVQIPELTPDWPPTATQLALLVTNAHWALEEIAYKLPRGEVSPERLAEVADGLEALAALLRNHKVVRVSLEEREQIVPEQETPGQEWVADRAMEHVRDDEFPDPEPDDSDNALGR